MWRCANSGQNSVKVVLRYSKTDMWFAGVGRVGGGGSSVAKQMHKGPD